MAQQRKQSFSRTGERFARKLLVFLVFAALGVFGFLFMRGRVIAVADGDTFTVLTERGGRERIRLYGIDCPEMGQDFGPEAREFAASLALFQDVRLTKITTDQYGRSVALVTLSDGTSLNGELVAQGYAMVYGQYCALPQCAAWKALEYKARKEKRGLWAADRVEPPWVWRRKHPR